MKIAVAFFNSKKKNIIKEKKIIEKSKNIKENKKLKDLISKNEKRNVKLESLYSNNMISLEYISVKNVLFVLILTIIYVMFFNNTLFLSTNIVTKTYTIFTKDNILALNNMLNKSNYNFTKKVEMIEEVVEENINYEVIDEIAQNYIEVPVFSKVTKEDIVVTAENQMYQKLNVCGIEIVNYSTNRDIDFVDIINSDDIFFSKRKDSILMYTTHTSESYANSKKYFFEYTSPARTTDGNYNMLSIATELGSNLKSKGISNICSINPHDYGEYNSAYMNSRLTAETILRENPDIALSIDVHRDAIEDLSFAPKINIRGLDVASMMFVIGIGYDNAPNEYYMDNLKLVFKLQLLANKVYPGLFRQIIIRNSVYNQDLNKYSFLVEVGATGNTIDEAKLSTRCLSNLINLLYKD